MKERPILFSGEMVRAILDGSKVQTRRLIKYNPFLGEPDAWIDRVRDADFKQIVGDYTRFCPYGQPGDRLWVRETWAAFTNPDYFTGECDEIPGPPRDMPMNYGADITNVVYRADGTSAPRVWRPSILMPRWASRITLLNIGVRAERVQDITDDDALREGIHPLAYEAYESPRMGFRELWDGTYGSGAWARNDGVWVIDFQRVDR